MIPRSLRSLEIVLFLLSLGIPSAPSGAAESSQPAAAQEAKPAALSLKLESPQDAARVATELTHSFLSEAEWKAKVKDFQRKFADWGKDNDGDIGYYLNTKLPALAYSASSGKVERLKEGAAFLALYYEFKQPLPKLVTEFVAENMASMNSLLAEYTWDKAGKYVSSKQWKKDAESAKRK